MKIRTKLLATLAVAAACHTPAFALVSFGDLSDQWTMDKKVPSAFAVMHYIHGAVETVIVQEALARKLNAGGVRLCKLFKADGDLVEPDTEIAKKVLARFREIAEKDPNAGKYSAPQMVLMQMDALYSCPAR